MRDKRSGRRPRHRGPYPARPVDDANLYLDVVANAKHFASQMPPAEAQKELAEFVMLSLEQWPDWSLMQMKGRARVFLACIRKEVGRRMQLDPRQVLLMEGITDGKGARS